jgi:hypothetical protein
MRTPHFPQKVFSEETAVAQEGQTGMPHTSRSSSRHSGRPARVVWKP